MRVACLLLFCGVTIFTHNFLAFERSPAVSEWSFRVAADTGSTENDAIQGNFGNLTRKFHFLFKIFLKLRSFYPKLDKDRVKMILGGDMSSVRPQRKTNADKTYPPSPRKRFCSKVFRNCEVFTQNLIEIDFAAIFRGRVSSIRPQEGTQANITLKSTPWKWGKIIFPQFQASFVWKISIPAIFRSKFQLFPMLDEISCNLTSHPKEFSFRTRVLGFSRVTLRELCKIRSVESMICTKFIVSHTPMHKFPLSGWQKRKKLRKGKRNPSPRIFAPPNWRSFPLVWTNFLIAFDPAAECGPLLHRWITGKQVFDSFVSFGSVLKGKSDKRVFLKPENVGNAILMKFEGILKIFEGLLTIFEGILTKFEEIFLSNQQKTKFSKEIFNFSDFKAALNGGNINFDEFWRKFFILNPQKIIFQGVQREI